MRRSVEPRGRRAARNLALAATTAIALRLTEKPVVDRLAAIVERRRWGLLQRRRLPAAVEAGLALALMESARYARDAPVGAR